MLSWLEEDGDIAFKLVDLKDAGKQAVKVIT